MAKNIIVVGGGKHILSKTDTKSEDFPIILVDKNPSFEEMNQRVFTITARKITSPIIISPKGKTFSKRALRRKEERKKKKK